MTMFPPAWALRAILLAALAGPTCRAPRAVSQCVILRGVRSLGHSAFDPCSSIVLYWQALYQKCHVVLSSPRPKHTTWALRDHELSHCGKARWTEMGSPRELRDEKPTAANPKGEGETACSKSHGPAEQILDRFLSLLLS